MHINYNKLITKILNIINYMVLATLTIILIVARMRAMFELKT